MIADMPKMRRSAAPKGHRTKAPAQRLPPASPASPPRGLMLWKKVAFAGLTIVAILMALELALWLCGVAPRYRRHDVYAGFTPQVPHFQVEADPGGRELVRVLPSKRETLNDQTFPRFKQPGTYRIVCLGGSATYGRPFFDHTSFAGWLRAFLPKADPSRKWEVINAGAISYASYRVKGLMAELAQYEPDLFIAYMGHNEFLERRTYAGVLETPGLIRDAAGLTSRTRLASVVQGGLELVGLLKPMAATKATGIGEEVTRIPLLSVGPEAYRRDETFKRQVLAHYAASLNSMVDIAAGAKARLLFVTPLSNLRDFAPIKSEHREDLTPEQHKAWQAAYEQGLSLAKRGQNAQAVDAFDTAAAIDDRHADLLFRKGRALLELGRDDDAESSFLKACEEDICPLRAISATLDTMRKVARARGVPLLDFEPLARARAQHKIPGDEFLADHVHLQIRASRMLALDIFDWLTSEKIVRPTADWGPAAVEAVTAQVEAGIDGRRYAHELYTLSQLLDSLSQPEQALKRVEEGLKMSGSDLEGLCLSGRYHGKLGRIQSANEFYHRALALHPGAPCAEEGLGVLLIEQGNPRAALDHLAAAARAAPDSASVFNRLGVACALVGRFDEAIAHLGRAAQLSPNDAPIRTNLGLAEERRGNRSAAIVHYRDALRLNPEYAEARSGLNRLSTVIDRTRGR
jgi:tetratricopeptide (TPR) repeat protein